MPTRHWLIALVVAVLTACASSPTGRRDLLDVVRPGAPRAEVVQRLGGPFATFEGERIMVWSIGEDEGGYFVAATRSAPGQPRSFARYDLVVVFDAEGRVDKLNLVEVHKP